MGVGFFFSFFCLPITRRASTHDDAAFRSRFHGNVKGEKDSLARNWCPPTVSATVTFGAQFHWIVCPPVCIYLITHFLFSLNYFSPPRQLRDLVHSCDSARSENLIGVSSGFPPNTILRMCFSKLGVQRWCLEGCVFRVLGITSVRVWHLWSTMFALICLI